MGLNRQAHMVIMGDSGGYPGNLATCTIQRVLSPVAFEALVSFVLEQTKGVLWSKARIVDEYALSTGKPIGVNVDRIAVAVFRNADTGRAIKISFPAPIDSIVEQTSGGARLTQDFMTQFATTINTNTENNVTPSYGYVIQKQ